MHPTDEEIVAIHNVRVDAYEARRRSPTPMEAANLEEARTIYALALSEALLIRGSRVPPSKAVLDRVVARVLAASSTVSRLEAELYMEAGADGA
jgi:hypothetical protein